MSLKTYIETYLWTILKDTLYMVLISGAVAIFFALFLGIALYLTRKSEKKWIRLLHKVMDVIVNILRSFPFYIMIFFLIPFTRIIMKILTGRMVSMSTSAFIVPLTVASIPFFAKLIENALLEVKEDKIEAAYSLGLSTTQVVVKVLLREALPTIISGITLGMITLIGFSSMAGVVSGGGIGAFAIDHGLTNYDGNAILYAVVTIILLVQGIQFLGNIGYRMAK